MKIRRSQPAAEDGTASHPQPQTLEEAWAKTRTELKEWPRGGGLIYACRLFTITYKGESYYRVVTREHAKIDGSYALPVTVCIPKFRQARLGATLRIEYGFLGREDKTVSVWHPIGDLPSFNQNAHVHLGVGELPNYCVLTKDLVPVPVSARSLSTRKD